jgi:hypothetical protein
MFTNPITLIIGVSLSTVSLFSRPFIMNYISDWVYPGNIFHYRYEFYTLYNKFGSRSKNSALLLFLLLHILVADMGFI